MTYYYFKTYAPYYFVGKLQRLGFRCGTAFGFIPSEFPTIIISSRGAVWVQNVPPISGNIITCKELTPDMVAKLDIKLSMGTISDEILF